MGVFFSIQGCTKKTKTTFLFTANKNNHTNMHCPSTTDNLPSPLPRLVPSSIRSDFSLLGWIMSLASNGTSSDIGSDCSEERERKKYGDNKMKYILYVSGYKKKVLFYLYLLQIHGIH